MSENIEELNGQDYKKDEDGEEGNESGNESDVKIETNGEGMPEVAEYSAPDEPLDVKEQEPKKKPRSDNNFAERIFSVHAVVSLYSLILISLGIVFPLAIYFSGGNFKKHGIHLAVYRFYTYGVGIFLYILAGYTVHVHSKAHREKKKRQDSERKRNPRREVYVINDDVTATRAYDDGLDLNTPEREEDVLPPIFEAAEGVNFFLRLGLVAFGLGGMLLFGIRVIEMIAHEPMRECYGIPFIASTILSFFYTVIQAGVLFKHHKIGINIYQPFFRLGILHNVATNISEWVSIIAVEAVEAYNHYVYNGGHGESETHHSSLTTGSFHPTPSSINMHQNSTDDDPSAALCVGFPNTLGTAASPYLFPFMIEYCLLAAAILFKMQDNIGPSMYYKAIHERKLEKLDRERFPDLYANQPHATQCTSANRGLFAGLLVIIIVGIGACFLLFFQTQNVSQSTHGYIYVISDLTVKIMVIFFVFPAYWQIRRLYFSPQIGNLLDQKLLLLALLGCYLLDGFTMVAALATISRGSSNELIMIGSRLIAATSIINFVQVTFLVWFIVDGLQRRSVTSQQVKDKPGRAFITFLLSLNLALWLIITFEMKMVHRFTIFSEYYGQLAWTIILSVIAPLAIYFRFHCAVCLSDIWVHAYKKSPIEDPHESPEAKYGKIL